MQMPTSSNTIQQTPPRAPESRSSTEPNFDSPPKAIAEFAGRPDFPRCTLDEHVDIGGYTGVVVDIVMNSIKVRAREGITQSFNFNRLRTLYAHRPEPMEMTRPEPSSAEADELASTPRPPTRDVIAAPNFEAPVQTIAEFVHRTDFPKCAYGAHVDIGGYVGVVVEIVNQSLKVRCVDGTSRSYNAAGLRKIYA